MKTKACVPKRVFSAADLPRETLSSYCGRSTLRCTGLGVRGEPAHHPAKDDALKWAKPKPGEETETDRLEAQIERFAPGFRNRILARRTHATADMEAYNPNYIGGDIDAGVQGLRQLFTRPVARLNPYTTPVRGLCLCSSSTPPGGGVHGLCGHYAGRTALQRLG
jgi:phytoene dehydrogenase-like protein